MRQELRELQRWRESQRARIKARLASSDRRRARMAVGVSQDIDEPLTALSDSLDAFQLEYRS